MDKIVLELIALLKDHGNLSEELQAELNTLHEKAKKAVKK